MSSSSTSSTPNPKVVDALDTARSELDAAFTEMYSIDLVQFEERAWTPQFRKLATMDEELVADRIAAARDSIAEAAALVDTGTRHQKRVELLRHVAAIAEHGSTFYEEFAITFERVYQYGYSIDEGGRYERAIRKIGIAREKLAIWKELGATLTEHVRQILQLYEDNPALEAKVPSFDVERWNYTTFGAEQYAYRLEPRFVAFEAYAEAVNADLTGLDHLEVGEFQAAQEEFQTARRKIDQAGSKFDEANQRGGSFFEKRADIYENRIPFFDDGYLLHLRAANEFVRGNTENANDLRFNGTTEIRNGFARYPIKEV